MKYTLNYKGETTMAAPEKVLVRKHRDSEELQLFVPSMEAPKGFIKRWDGSTGYEDVRLEVYETTRNTTADEANGLVDLYITVTGKDRPKIGERLRNYQTKGDFGDSYFIRTTKGGVYVIEDAKGKLIKGYSSQELAIRDLELLIQGRDIT